MSSWIDSRTVSRLISALGLVLGPGLYLVSAVVSPAFMVASEEPLEFLDAVAEDRSLHLMTALLFLAGTVFFIAGVIGVMHLLRGGRTVSFGQVSAAIVLVGLIAVANFYLLNVVTLEMTDQDADAEQMAALLERIEEGSGGTVLMALFSTGTAAGLLLLAAALFLRRAVPVWSPAALVLAVVVGFFPDAKLYSVGEFALLFLGTAPIGWRIWTLSDEEWERWQPLPQPTPSTG